MKNILSYSLGSVFTGKEIKDWINYNIENKTSQSKPAKKLSRYIESLEDESKYTLAKEHKNHSNDDGEYIFQRIREF